MKNMGKQNAIQMQEKKRTKILSELIEVTPALETGVHQ